MTQFLNIANDSEQIIKFELAKIEALFGEECRRVSSSYKDDYEIVSGMGVFVVAKNDYNISLEEYPKKILELDRFWNSMIDKYGFYMIVEKKEWRDA